MKSCPTCNRTYTDETLNFCLADGSPLSAAYDDEATQISAAPPMISPPAPTEVLPAQAAKGFNIYGTPDYSQTKSKKSALVIGGVIALALMVIVGVVVVVAAIIAVNVSDNKNKNSSTSNKQTIKEGNKNSVTSPAKTSLKDAFPQTAGDFTLQDTYQRSELKGDDQFLPDAEDVMGAVYKSSANKKEQVMAGLYASASAAEAARDKRVSSSKYVARWTKGNILYVATDATFKDNL